VFGALNATACLEAGRRVARVWNWRPGLRIGGTSSKILTRDRSARHGPIG